jgi:hypothetical protein
MAGIEPPLRRPAFHIIREASNSTLSNYNFTNQH